MRKLQKLGTVLTVMLAAVSGAVVAASPASASIPGTTTAARSLGSGQFILAVPAGQGRGGVCTIAAVGYDKFGNKVALTAGHCGKPGWEVYSYADPTNYNPSPTDASTLSRIGTFATSHDYGSAGIGRPGGFVANVLDYGFIKLNANVTLADWTGNPPDITSIAAPAIEIVCKYGFGNANINNVGERCGTTYTIRPLEFENTMLIEFGDSGGPVYRNRTQLVGIVSRPVGVPYVSSAILTRADAAIADATARNEVGAGFVPVH